MNFVKLLRIGSLKVPPGPMPEDGRGYARERAESTHAGANRLPVARATQTSVVKWMGENAILRKGGKRCA